MNQCRDAEMGAARTGQFVAGGWNDAAVHTSWMLGGNNAHADSSPSRLNLFRMADWSGILAPMSDIGTSARAHAGQRKYEPA